MREYKFRGKNKDIGWVYGQLAYDINGNAYIIQEVELDSSYELEETILFATMWYRVDKETVGQYTGRKDKNGKEICEGDILTIPEWLINDNQEVCVCIYDQENTVSDIIGFGLYTTDGYSGKFKILVYSDEWDEFKVIGNIYDNPELLGGNNGD